MIELFLFWSISLIIVIFSSWFAYDKFKKYAAKLQQQEIQLRDQTNDFNSSKRNFMLLCEKQLNEILLKKSEVIELYQAAVKKIVESHEIRDQTQNQVIAMQKQIGKLQSELYNSRQRSKRLAEKNVAL